MKTRIQCMPLFLGMFLFGCSSESFDITKLASTSSAENTTSVQNIGSSCISEETDCDSTESEESPTDTGNSTNEEPDTGALEESSPEEPGNSPPETEPMPEESETDSPEAPSNPETVSEQEPDPEPDTDTEQTPTPPESPEPPAAETPEPETPAVDPNEPDTEPVEPDTGAATSAPPEGISGGALNGDSLRVLVSADLPDARDDLQSLIHLLLVSDVLDLEGIITSHSSSTPSTSVCEDKRGVDCANALIDQYEIDYAALRTWSSDYPHPDSVRDLLHKGQESPWTGSGQTETDGSRLIVERALAADSRPLYIMVWGAISNTATALYHHPEIAGKIRIIMSAGDNVAADQDAYDYIRTNFPDVLFVQAEGAAYGLRYPEQSVHHDNTHLCNAIRVSGEMGRSWCDTHFDYKEHDFVTAYYLLAGNPENPAADHWAGSFELASGNHWLDHSSVDYQSAVEDKGVINGVLSAETYRLDRHAHLLERFARLAAAKATPQYDIYQITIADDSGADPYSESFTFKVHWTLPDGSTRSSDGFYDENGLYKARAYTSQTGLWRWESESSVSRLDGLSGEFTVATSSLPGKLKKHDSDPFQFQYGNGEWYLHLGDTAYRFVNQYESQWRNYLSQAQLVGFTKLRTWFNHGRHDVQILFNGSRDGLNTEYWQEIERRLRYASIYYPYMQFQLIPYGEDTAEIRRYGSDRMTQMLAKEAQARFSALPNVQWCIVNDREIVFSGSLSKERQVYASSIEQIGSDMAAREPWGTLITNHQARWEGYDFVDSSWSDIITLEDLDQIGGDLVTTYRSRSNNDPVIMEEDRYELYRGPSDPGFFFRRLFWSNLLAGGHATYGGLATYEAAGDNDTQGIIGYYDSASTSKPLKGADQLHHIQAFFDDSNATLVGFTQNTSIANKATEEVIAANRGDTVILYISNPDSSSPEFAKPAGSSFSFSLSPVTSYAASEVNWFNPRNGQWQSHNAAINSGSHSLSTPDGGDWVLVLGTL